MLKAALLVALFILQGEAQKCIHRDFGHGSTVCVCNSTYCDRPPEPNALNGNNYNAFVSSKDGLRMQLFTGQFETEAAHDIQVYINSNITFQTMKGFGCAFTDSAGINMLKLSEEVQDAILSQYFGNDGCRYEIGRVPIGGTDFSTRNYTLDDTVNDMKLEKFSLQFEDTHYKIPFVQKALKLKPDLTIFGSPWSPPVWMKTNGKINGLGFLKYNCYQAYANYLLKFIDSYAKNDIPIWGITTGNEPINGLNIFGKLNSMAWTPFHLGQWIANHLGPTLMRSKYNKTVIMVLDDQRLLLPWYVELLFRNEEAAKYVSGIAIHWYTDDFIPSSVLSDTHEVYPEKFLLMTEACTGSKLWDWPKVSLGSWRRGEEYIIDMIDQINHWSTGWVDWNYVLDAQGGPNWIKNYVDSPIIVNPEKNEFFKQPMYYAMCHASRHVPKNSVRIAITETENIKATAFKVPSGETVAVLYNRNGSPLDVSINDANKHGAINYRMPGQSMHTLIYT